MNAESFALMHAFLLENGVKYNDSISEMVIRRNKGEAFSFSEHLSALIYAMLTNQTKWSRIVPHLPEIDELFFFYDPKEIKQRPSTYFSDGIFNLKCGNISTAAQMKHLHYNIQVMEKIVDDYGSMDAFITSEPAHKIVRKISHYRSRYKIKMLGEALAWEYVRNVGIDACKPDTHLRRFLGGARMGCSLAPVASVEEVLGQVEVIAKENNVPQSMIDNVIWSYCADGYGQICTAIPKCDMCVINNFCKYPCTTQDNEQVKE
jgi:hypothetical protein